MTGKESRPAREPIGTAGTQEVLCAEIDLDLSWSETELPRASGRGTSTAYLGKFVPHLVEELLPATIHQASNSRSTPGSRWVQPRIVLYPR